MFDTHCKRRRTSEFVVKPSYFFGISLMIACCFNVTKFVLNMKFVNDSGQG